MASFPSHNLTTRNLRRSIQAITVKVSAHVRPIALPAQCHVRKPAAHQSLSGLHHLFLQTKFDNEKSIA